MRRNIALEKSEDFGVRIVELYKYLYKQKAPEPIITQITKVAHPSERIFMKHQMQLRIRIFRQRSISL